MARVAGSMAVRASALAGAMAAMLTATTWARQAPAAAPPGNADTGKALFLKNGCYQCHGTEGQGGAAGPRLAPDPIPFRAIEAYVRAPRGDMPPYTAKVMSEQQLADIYAYLKARPRPPALENLPLLAR